jgi:Chlamydia polymorphic membrane protein (Chlamydia_PMP) repeat
VKPLLRRFINNTADVLGGAIKHVGSKSDRLAITGSTFTGNAAGESGT